MSVVAIVGLHHQGTRKVVTFVGGTTRRCINRQISPASPFLTQQAFSFSVCSASLASKETPADCGMCRGTTEYRNINQDAFNSKEPVLSFSVRREKVIVNTR